MGSKPEVVARLLFEIFYVLSPWKPRNEKIFQGRKFVKRVEADI